ncbi:MAG: rhodanese-like domain-containing protein [Chromatiales bacterium]
MAHIPGSINIPHGNEGVFERRFAKDKEIIVYCGSPDCPASENVAAALVTRGFRRVYHYAGGLTGNKADTRSRRRLRSKRHLPCPTLA